MARMAAARSDCAADGIVDGAPVSQLDVLPRLVVGKRRLVVQRRRSICAGRRTGALGDRERRQAQRQGASRGFQVGFHCSKHLDRRHGRGARPATTRAWARALLGLAQEALRGQMLRGGRSCPSDRKLGGGAKRSGKAAAATSWSAGIVGKLPTKEVAEQNAEQRLQLS